MHEVKDEQKAHRSLLPIARSVTPWQIHPSMDSETAGGCHRSYLRAARSFVRLRYLNAAKFLGAMLCSKLSSLSLLQDVRRVDFHTLLGNKPLRARQEAQRNEDKQPRINSFPCREPHISS